MAYIVPTTKNVGDAIKKEDFDVIHNDLADLNARTSSVESASSVRELLTLDVRLAAGYTTLTGLIHFPCPFTITLTDCFIQIYEKGSLTGTLEIDIKKNTTPDDTGMTSVFSTKPSIAYSGASDYEKSTNQTFNVTQSTVDKDDILRVDITSLPTSGYIGKFLLVLRGEI